MQARFEERARRPSREEADRLLALGHPVSFRNPNTPINEVLVQYPDGHIESVKYALVVKV
jgi:hypothetical protein